MFFFCIHCILFFSFASYIFCDVFCNIYIYQEQTIKQSWWMHKSFVERSPVISQVLKTEQNMGFSEKSKMGKISFNLAMCDCHRVLTAYNSLSCISTLPNQLYSWMPKFLGMIFLSHNTPLITAWVNEMQFFKKQIETFFSFWQVTKKATSQKLLLMLLCHHLIITK